MIPISFMPVVWVVVISIVGGALFWLVDEIGDRREQKVWRKINAAIEKTNVDVERFSDLDDKISAIAEDARKKAVDAAKQIKSTQSPATAEQAEALSRIR